MQAATLITAAVPGGLSPCAVFKPQGSFSRGGQRIHYMKHWFPAVIPPEAEDPSLRRRAGTLHFSWGGKGGAEGSRLRKQWTGNDQSKAQSEERVFNGPAGNSFVRTVSDGWWRAQMGGNVFSACVFGIFRHICYLWRHFRVRHTNILRAPIINLFWPPAAKTAPDWLQLCGRAPNMRAETKSQRNSYFGAPETGRQLQQAEKWWQKFMNPVWDFPTITPAQTGTSMCQ